jgi:hypothetical protein
MITNETDPVVAEQTLSLGRTLTVITQYDRSLFDGERITVDDFIKLAARRFERVLRQELTDGSDA